MAAPGVGIQCETKTYLSGGTPSTNDNDGDQYALVVKESFDASQTTKRSLLVNSPFILKALHDSAAGSDLQEPLHLDSPFRLLHHNWDEIEEYYRLTTDDNARAHLHLLIEFMHSELGAERKRIQASIRTRQIGFEDLWYLLVPGQELYHSDGDHPWLLRCDKLSYRQDATRGPICLVTARYTDRSGDMAGEAELQVVIERSTFDRDGLANIVDLPVYPLEFWAGDATHLQKRLEDRGSLFLALSRGVHFKHYDGVAKYLQPRTGGQSHYSESGGEWLPFTETGRVIIDQAAYEREAGTRNLLAVDAIDPLTCPLFVVGYSPHRKTWCRYYVDNLSEIEWKADPWDSLLLQDRHKRTIKALIEFHSLPEDPYDEARQKGKGLVMLLHGHHGTGKTMTAETAAESANKVIIPLSPADLTTKDHLSTEHHLTQLFQNASKWGAILLLENADHFLSPNSNSPTLPDLLRRLEYFSGITFLTTNRLSALDAAVKSHVSLALTYESPGPESRRQLWLLFLSMVPEAELDMTPDKDVDRWHLMAEKLNGREIAHAVRTARTLARAEGVPLQLDHLLTVLGMRREFETALAKESGVDGQGAASPAPEGGIWKEGIMPSTDWIPASISSLPRLAVAKAKRPF
ncbi:AAA family [Podospora aff. communis PSN243]|uniref:AAA family n=1 Tax=Podospora aff. communis PSN243 TaxID=3040156 RepID=A0AAV9G6T2_9PEZI|nr:AAA family [Podospora aff. communis PSN243]